MIQRQQSLWLILATICAFLSFKFPFVTGTEIEKSISRSVLIMAGSNFFLLVLTGASILISLITIFLYKDRKMQLRLCYVGIVIAFLLLILYIIEMRKLMSPTLALSCVFVLAVLVGYIMAARGIWKDERLVKSLDKLR
jgi:hypothetical protein